MGPARAGAHGPRLRSERGVRRCPRRLEEPQPVAPDLYRDLYSGLHKLVFDSGAVCDVVRVTR